MVGFWYYVDYNKDVHFEPMLTNPSMLPNNTLLVDSDTQNYGDLIFSEDVSQIRNQVYYYGHKLPMPTQITENFAGDGQKQTFNLTYEPKHSLLLTDVTITVGGVAQTNALDIINATPGSGTPGCAYIYYTNQTMRFSTAPGNGVVASVTYFPLLPTQNMYNNPASFTLMKARDGSDGVYEYGITNKNLTASDTSLVNLAGAGQLLKYDLPHYAANFYSFTQGWKPGQYFFMTSDMRMDGQFQNTEFYVLKVTKVIVNHPKDGTPFFKNQLSCADTPYNL
jgi:hypothetical protein